MAAALKGALAIIASLAADIGEGERYNLYAENGRARKLLEEGALAALVAPAVAVGYLADVHRIIKRRYNLTAPNSGMERCNEAAEILAGMANEAVASRFEGVSVADLRELADALKIEVPSKAKRSELVALVAEAENAAAAAEETAEDAATAATAATAGPGDTSGDAGIAAE